MLAYVFWHLRKEELLSVDAYEQKLSKFHEALGRSNLEGFRGSFVAKINGAPWFSSNSREGYEDWYLLDGSQVLDRLNETAVSDSRKDPHDEIARFASDFRGGLYQLKSKSSSSSTSQNDVASWISKPVGTTYDTFYAEISKYLPKEGSSLWRRQMVLGPTPEFCITAREPADLPIVFKPIVIHRKIIFRSGEI